MRLQVSRLLACFIIYSYPKSGAALQADTHVSPNPNGGKSTSTSNRLQQQQRHPFYEHPEIQFMDSYVSNFSVRYASKLGSQSSPAIHSSSRQVHPTKTSKAWARVRPMPLNQSDRRTLDVWWNRLCSYRRLRILPRPCPRRPNQLSLNLVELLPS